MEHDPESAASQNADPEDISGVPNPPRIWLWCLILVLIAAGGVLGARPVWRALKATRAEKHLRLAEDALRQGNLSDAVRQATLGLQLKPRDPRMMRTLGRTLSQANARAGLECWRQVLALPDASDQDRESFVDLCLALDQPQLAYSELKRLL